MRRGQSCSTRTKELEEQVTRLQAELAQARRQLLGKQSRADRTPDTRLADMQESRNLVVQQNLRLRQEINKLSRNLEKAQQAHRTETSSLREDNEKLKLELQKRDQIIEKLRASGNGFSWEGTDYI